MNEGIKFGTKDRYFSDKNEKRIGRVSFFLRMLSIVIMTTLLGIAINIWLMNLIGLNIILAGPIVMILSSIVVLFSVPILAKKRCHDFDSNGKIVSYIMRGSLGLTLILNIDTLYLFYTDSFASLMEPNILIQIISYVSMGLGIASLISILILLFRPGTVGTNNYGELTK